MVVHREPEQDHEQEHRQPGGDAAVRVEVEQVLAPAPLEDRDQDAVGGGDRQQVQDDRLERRSRSSGTRRAAAGTRSVEDEGEHERHAERFIASFQSVDAAVSPGDARTSTPGDLADRRRQDLVPQRREGLVRACVGALARRAGSSTRDGRCRSVRRRPRSGSSICPVASASLLELGDRRLQLPGPTASAGIATTRRGRRRPGTRRLDLVDTSSTACELTSAARRGPSRRCAAAAPGRPATSEHGGGGERPRRAAGAGRGRGSRPRSGSRRRRGGAGARNGTRALLDPVAEPRQHRRQDGQRAEHRDGDDDHRADRRTT